MLQSLVLIEPCQQLCFGHHYKVEIASPGLVLEFFCMSRFLRLVLWFLYCFRMASRTNMLLVVVVCLRIACVDLKQNKQT